MSTLANVTPGEATKGRCYGCFRPVDECFCDAIPRLVNRTPVLLVQHQRERFHPFNTARIVHRALSNSQLLIGNPNEIAARLALQPGAGLLFPGRDARLVDQLAPDERPPQLVVVDGTWHHAKTLLREVSALRTLPRYQLAPREPSRFHIRRQPNPLALSTLEATVAALRALEPETPGFERLLTAFNVMVEQQLAHPKVNGRWYQNRSRRVTTRNIPSALLGDLSNIVVTYGESTPGERGSKPRAKAPVYWVAERLGTGERFACAIEPCEPLSDELLIHFDLPRAAWAEAAAIGEFDRRWRAFLRRDDVLVAFNQSTPRLLTPLGHEARSWLLLKCVDLRSPLALNSPDALVESLGLAGVTTWHGGRAGRRLAWTVAYINYLRQTAGVAAASE